MNLFQPGVYTFYTSVYPMTSLGGGEGTQKNSSAELELKIEIKVRRRKQIIGTRQLLCTHENGPGIRGIEENQSVMCF